MVYVIKWLKIARLDWKHLKLCGQHFCLATSDISYEGVTLTSASLIPWCHNFEFMKRDISHEFSSLLGWRGRWDSKCFMLHCLPGATTFARMTVRLFHSQFKNWKEKEHCAQFGELGEILGNCPLVRTTNLFNPHPSAIKPVCSNHYIDRDSVGWISINRNILHVFHWLFVV